jgi:hypothetical protein
MLYVYIIMYLRTYINIISTAQRHIYEITVYPSFVDIK